MLQREQVFLSAEWRDLVFLNYEVAPALLTKYLPSGTELDSFSGKTYVSLVGFRFCRTKMFGVATVPFHANFDEVNLRFYVRRQHETEVRRGVVFIAEVVPRRAVAMIARVLYGENYVCLPMRHRIRAEESRRTLEYQFQATGRAYSQSGSHETQANDRWCRLTAETSSLPALPAEGSVEQFITEHYWGYSKQREGGPFEYHVSHVPWQVWCSSEASFEGDVSSLYGEELGRVLQVPPSSAFIADGSPIVVFKGRKIS